MNSLTLNNATFCNIKFPKIGNISNRISIYILIKRSFSSTLKFLIDSPSNDPMEESSKGIKRTASQTNLDENKPIKINKVESEEYENNSVSEESENNPISEEKSALLSSIKDDEKRLDRVMEIIVQESDKLNKEATENVGEFNSLVNQVRPKLSAETNREIGSLDERYSRLKEIAQNELDKRIEKEEKATKSDPDYEPDNDNMKEIKYYNWAIRDVSLNQYNKTINSITNDDNISEAEREQLSNLKEKFSEFKNKDKIFYEYGAEYDKEKKDYNEKIEQLGKLKEQEKKLSGDNQELSKGKQKLSQEDNQESPKDTQELSKDKQGSLVEDFADPSTEMPSYTDPED